MKLVVYYSRTGNTKKLAENISKKLKCDIDEIKYLKQKKGIIGLIKAGHEAIRKAKPKIKIQKDPSKYDQVIIGTPVWTSNMASPVRSYLMENSFKKVAFFCTQDGTGDKQTFKAMEDMSKKPIATISFKTQEIKKEFDISKFASKL